MIIILLEISFKIFKMKTVFIFVGTNTTVTLQTYNESSICGKLVKQK